MTTATPLLFPSQNARFFSSCLYRTEGSCCDRSSASGGLCDQRRLSGRLLTQSRITLGMITRLSVDEPFRVFFCVCVSSLGQAYLRFISRRALLPFAVNSVYMPLASWMALEVVFGLSRHGTSGGMACFMLYFSSLLDIMYHWEALTLSYCGCACEQACFFSVISLPP